LNLYYTFNLIPANLPPKEPLKSQPKKVDPISFDNLVLAVPGWCFLTMTGDPFQANQEPRFMDRRDPMSLFHPL